MFEVECAFRRTETGPLEFLPDTEAPEGHDDWCVLRVAFVVHQIYPREPDTGADWDWSGDIASIEARRVDADFARFRRLRDAELEAARAFLLRVHGRELWQAGDEHVAALFLGEAA